MSLGSFFVMYSELIRCDSRTLLIFAIACRNVLPFTVAVLVEREVEKNNTRASVDSNHFWNFAVCVFPLHLQPSIARQMPSSVLLFSVHACDLGPSPLPRPAGYVVTISEPKNGAHFGPKKSGT